MYDEDSNGVRRDGDGRVLPCACAEHGEECGLCMAKDREVDSPDWDTYEYGDGAGRFS